MRKISVWARHHRVSAVASLVMLKLLLAFLAFYLGSALLDLDIHIPLAAFAIALAILVTAALLYPSRRNSVLSKSKFYIRQKTCDFTVAACSFIMIGTLVNNNCPLPLTMTATASTVAESITPTAEEILASLQYRDKSSLTKHEKRILKEEFKKQLKVYAKAKLTGDKKGGQKALFIILTIIGAVGLLYLVAALACSLSCNGSDALALIVVLIGAVAVIWGAIAIIRRISRGPGKKKVVSPETGK